MSAFLTLTALVVLAGSPIVPLAGALGRAAARRSGGHDR